MSVQFLSFRQTLTLLFFFQEMIASHTSYVSNFYKYASQKSSPIYLHKGEKYYYEAFMGDYGHYYRFEMGLFGRRTEHTKALTDKAQDEIQQIRISTQKVPRIMVRDILYRGLFFLISHISLDVYLSIHFNVKSIQFKT